MSKTPGVIVDADGGGFTAGYVGDLPIAEAISTVQSGRLTEDYPHSLLGLRDVQDLLDGLGVTGIAELAALVAAGREASACPR